MAGALKAVRYVLDTTFIIDHLRGVPEAVDRFRRLYEDGDEPIVTEIVTTEAWSGAQPNGNEALERLLRYLEYVHPGPATARLAGTWRADARRRGRTLSLPDALIAATAHELAAAVLTRNVRDYALTPVRLEPY
jgi:predicted nucleic acid-binding protein